MRKAANLNRPGFTVVECLIAGVILALFAASLAAATAQSGRAAMRAQDHRQAAQWLDTVLTRIDMLGPYQLSVQGPVEGPLDERFSWSAVITEDLELANLYRVSVTVSYRGRDERPGRIVGHTQFYDPAGMRTLEMPWEEL